MRFLFLALAAAVVLGGCSGGGNNNQTVVFDFAGEWQGNWADGSGTASMNLAPVGDHLEGTFATASSCIGGWPAIGYLIGGNLSLTLPAINGLVVFTQLGSGQITSTGMVSIPPCGVVGQLLMSRVVADTAQAPPRDLIFFYDERGNLIGTARRR